MHKGIHAAGNKRRIVNSIHAGAEIALLNIIPGPTYNAEETNRVSNVDVLTRTVTKV